MSEKVHSQGDFEEALREWGRRPPRTASDEAAEAVMASLPERPKGLGYWRPLAACAATLVVVLAVWLLVPGSQTAHRITVAETISPPVDEDEQHTYGLSCDPAT